MFWKSQNNSRIKFKGQCFKFLNQSISIWDTLYLSNLTERSKLRGKGVEYVGRELLCNESIFLAMDDNWHVKTSKNFKTIGASTIPFLYVKCNRVFHRVSFRTILKGIPYEIPYYTLRTRMERWTVLLFWSFSMSYILLRSYPKGYLWKALFSTLHNCFGLGIYVNM